MITAVRSSRKAGATAAAFILAAALSGCSAAAGDTPGAGPETSAASGESPAVHTGVAGTGTMVTTDDGSYERMTWQAPQSTTGPFPEDPYTPQDRADLEAIGMEGYLHGVPFGTVNFISEEFLDSPALEKGKAGFDEWAASFAPIKHLHPDFLARPDYQSGTFLLGTKTQNLVPHLIHDGKPRASRMDIRFIDVKAARDETGQAAPMVDASFEYEVDYRTRAADLADYLAHHAGISTEELMETRAKDVLKDADPDAEMPLRVHGTFQIGMSPDGNQGLKVYWTDWTSKVDTGMYAD